MLEFGLSIPTVNDAMLDNEFLNRLSKQLATMVPMAEEMRADLRTKIEQLLRASLANFDVLSRSEFDAQAQALQRAQRRVAELEQTLAQLDSRLTELEAQSNEPR